MKRRFKSIQQFANYITTLDNTSYPGDELTISEAMNLARIFCTQKYTYGTKNSVHGTLWLCMGYAPKLITSRFDALTRASESLNKDYNNSLLFRWKMSKILKAYNI